MPRLFSPAQALLFCVLTGVCGLAAEIPPPLELILAPEGGNATLDLQIGELQTRIKAASEQMRGPLIEKLGWTFVSKARTSNDPGFYKLAEQCAAWLQSKSPEDPSGMLLRGHILDAMHRFHDAEDAGLELVKTAPHSWESFALLGDALMEQGRLNEAVEVYQKMVDIRPCSQTYQRVGHIRWLKGDLEGALEMARLAVEAGSTRDPEPAAWAYTHLALLQCQNHDATSAEWSLNRAQQFVPEYAPALLLRGKMLLAEGKNTEAVELLKTAEQRNPLPEYRWALADAQRAAGLPVDAQHTESILERRGALDDPRTFSLYLSTRAEQTGSEQSARALELAQKELDNRKDVFTHDSLAWASLASGKLREAQTEIHAALSEGTQDARLLLHAAIISSAAGEKEKAAKYFQEASALKEMLLPSERDLLSQVLNRISQNQSTQASTNEAVPNGQSSSKP